MALYCVIAELTYDLGDGHPRQWVDGTAGHMSSETKRCHITEVFRGAFMKLRRVTAWLYVTTNVTHTDTRTHTLRLPLSRIAQVRSPRARTARAVLPVPRSTSGKTLPMVFGTLPLGAKVKHNARISLLPNNNSSNNNNNTGYAHKGLCSFPGSSFQVHTRRSKVRSITT